MSEYPEHDRLIVVAESSQAIYDFVEWLRGKKGIELGTWVEHSCARCVRAGVPRDECEYREDHDRSFELSPVSMERLLAGFFGIDLDKIDNEKRAMIAALTKGEQ